MKRTFSDIIAIVGVVIAIIAIVVSVTTPEIRNLVFGSEEKTFGRKEQEIENAVSKSVHRSRIDSVKKPIEVKPSLTLKKGESNGASVNPKAKEPTEKPTNRRANPEFENILYSGSAGSLEGNITFFNTDNKMFEFTGVLEIYNVGGFMKKEGNKLVITECENCSGYFTLMENGNKIIGTPTVYHYGISERLSVVLYRKP